MTRKIVSFAACMMFMTSIDASAADTAAGRAVSDRQCLQCHDASDWEGESAASLVSLIRDIVAGKVKHKTKIQLSDTEIENIAAYWANAGK